MKTLILIPKCDRCGDIPNITLGRSFWGHGCVCGGQYRDKPKAVPVFSKQLGAQYALANKKDQKAFTIRPTENGWWALIPL